MTLKELLDRCEFQDIAPYILKIFPEHKYQLIYYKMAFDILRNMKLELNPDSNVKQIEIFYFEEYDVSVYSCEGDYWESSLAKEIVLLDGLTLANEEIAARCLWSITFYGFSPSERDETFDSFGNFEKRFPSQATIIKNTIRTLTFDTSSFKSEELQYLFDTEPFIREYRSYSYQADQRIGYLIDLIANYERIDFLEYTDFILMFRTSPEYPLTRSETDTLQNFFREYLPASANIRFGYGEDKKLDSEIGLLLVGNCEERKNDEEKQP